jgi:hypothetical protein
MVASCITDASQSVQNLGQESQRNVNECHSLQGQVKEFVETILVA